GERLRLLEKQRLDAALSQRQRSRDAADSATRDKNFETLARHDPPESKSREIRERHLAGVHVHAAQFRAAVQRREYFSGVEQALGIEGAFHALLLGEVNFRKHRRHQVALFDADAVLAGEDAADLDAKLQNVASECFGLV